MTLEELWQLFPIFLTKNDKTWKKQYENEEKFLQNILPKTKIKRIIHIGSTYLTTIYAKPIIDILVETYRNANLKEIKNILVKNGYICMNEEQKRLSFNKGYTPKGFANEVYHLHLRLENDNDELYFRDYLIDFPNIAKKYERLKLRLAKKYKYNRDAYTNAKTKFVKKYTNKARHKYTNKYN